jgi:hypothetical protein
MTATIIIGQSEALSAGVQIDGAALAIDPTTTVNASLVSLNGQTILAAPRTCDPNAAGASWGTGIVVAAFTSIETGTLTPGPPDIMLVLAGIGFVKRFRVHVEEISNVPRSLLFIRDLIVEELRANQLILMAQNFFPGITLSDDFLWNNVQGAESEIARTLRVPLVPTQFVPLPQGQDPGVDAVIAGLPPGMPWAVDAPYDYDPEFFTGEQWGFIPLRWKPLVSVQLIRFVYPAPTTGFYNVPGDWLRVDQKYAHIRMVPASSPFVAPLNAFILQALGGGRTIPFALQITYISGITDAWGTYPELIDVIKKTAILKILEDGFFPQSASINADGLSQSMSIDMRAYRDTINTILNGPKGSNGGLMTAIHGIRGSAFGQGP